jgi:hypothetical protein
MGPDSGPLVASPQPVTAFETDREAARFVERLNNEAAPDLEAWEQALKVAALASGARALAPLLEGVDATGAASSVSCACGSPMHIVGRRQKTLTTLLGAVCFRRRLYVCPSCGCSRFPADEALDVRNTGFSPGVRRLMVRAGSRTSFADAEDDLRAYALLEVNRRDIERIAEEVGRQIEAWQVAQPAASAPTDPGPALYVSFDGTAVPMRKAELRGRKGKQPDGSAKGREVKVGCVFTQTRVDEAGLPVRDPDSTTYVAGLESSTLFGERIVQEARRRGWNTPGAWSLLPMAPPTTRPSYRPTSQPR